MERYWHVTLSSGEQRGPLREQEVQQLLLSKALTGRNYCWTDGFAEWIPLEKVDAFEPVLNQVSAPAIENPVQEGWGVLKDTFDRGKRGALRTMKSAKLRMQIAQRQKERNRLCALLGAEVFERRTSMELTNSLRAKIQSIVNCDQEIASIETQATRIESEG